jgi:tetratricopeptide (TPR) repeat protein
MSTIDSSGDSKDSRAEGSVAREFEQALERAESLLQEERFDQSLELLEQLEERYVQGGRLFQLIADVHMRQGNVEAGVRYRTLHDLLSGAFRIVTDKVPAHRVTGVPRAGKGTRQERLEEARSASTGTMEVSAGYYAPVTASMGDLYMRQGHYGKAYDVFERLVLKNPDDPALRRARDQAFKKHRSERLLGVLEHWLANIEKMKAK